MFFRRWNYDRIGNHNRRFPVSAASDFRYYEEIQVNTGPGAFRGFSMEGKTMKKWIFTASIDGNLIDYETIIESDTEPDFWTCYNLAAEHGCTFFSVTEE